MKAFQVGLIPWIAAPLRTHQFRSFLNTLLCTGGEKKRNEILQMSVLDAELSILDEIDSGLDIDALKDVASAVNGLKKPETATIMVTHYKVGLPSHAVLASIY